MAWENGEIYSFSLDCKEIDDAHDEFIKMLRKLFEKSRKEEKLDNDYMKMLDRYIDHCTIEEDMMRILHWKYAEGHIHYHRMVQCILVELQKHILNKTVCIEVFLTLVENLFKLHLEHEDKILAENWNEYCRSQFDQAACG